jgi:hypothetical protein
MLRLATAAPVPGPALTARNAELIAHVPLNYDSSGGRIVGKKFYLTTSRDFRIYDIATPEAPVLLGSIPLVQEPQFSEEDLDTNGKIALVESLGTLNVIDVSVPTAPSIMATLATSDYHTVSCVLGCRYAYTSTGIILDLTDPRRPHLVGNWMKGTGVSDSHDVTEVKPGLIVSSSMPILLLDARKDPIHPKVLARGSTADGRFIHANRWPRRTQDRFLLAGGETLGPDCGAQDAGAFMTWDASRWRRGSFKMIDEYRVTNGLPSDGAWPYGQLCAHWFTEHPTFRNGGLVAMAWYESGVRFLRVSAKGAIGEIGHLIAPGSVASAAYWVTDRLVYVLDYVRGFDVIRFTGPLR